MNRRSSGAASFLAELKRRSVFKVAAVYAATAWGASMGAAELLPAFGAPDWSVRAFVLLAVLGLPIAIVIAWAYEITPHGIVRDGMDEPETTAPKPPVASRTTMLLGPAGSVHVSWQDAAGVHERSFTRDFRIGRDEGCELHLDDPLISRRHVEISHNDTSWWITDLGSSNGTLLDQRRISRARLPPVCVVKLYDTGPPLRVEVRTVAHARTITAPRVTSPD
jgi:FHA domain